MNEEAFQILFDVMERHFAALKIPDSESDYKLTRALSFSELPSARRICVEQCYQSANSPGLVRQYSCEQIFDTASNTRQVKISEIVKTANDEHKKTWETTVPSFNEFKIPEYQPRKIKNIIQPSKLIRDQNMRDQIEYMDVEETDSEKHTIFPSAYSTSVTPEAVTQTCQTPCPLPQVKSDSDGKQTNDNTTVQQNDYKDLKKKLRPLVPTTKTVPVQKKGNMCSCCKLLFFLLLPIAFLVIGILVSHKELPLNICNHQNDFINASIELREKIHGHTDQIQTLINHLEEDSLYLKIICIVGGTGVGKSYTTEIIRRNFPHKEHIFLYFPPLKSDINTNIFSLRSGNLLILENLREHDIFDIVHLSKALMSVKNCCITLLAVFNVEHTDNDLARKIDLSDNIEAIKASFSKENVDAAVIGYESLNDETLEKCVMDAAKASDLKLTKDQIERIKESLSISNSGCKGAYSKVQVIGRE